MPLEINPALDTTYLDRVYGEDSNIIYLIFDAFLTDCLPRWKTLKTLLHDENLVEAASVIHGLKPSFTMAGLSIIKKQVEELETLVRSKSANEILVSRYKTINDQLEELVPILKTEAGRLRNLRS